MNDLHLYERVAEELRHQGPQPGLWAKAFAESGGSKPQAEALYLRYRVAQLAGEECAKRVRDDQVRRAMEEREEMERRQRAKDLGLTPIHWLLIGLGAFFFVLLAARGLAQL